MTKLKRMQVAIASFQEKQEGDDLTEYAVIFVLTSIIIIASLNLLTDAIDHGILMIAAQFQ